MGGRWSKNPTTTTDVHPAFDEVLSEENVEELRMVTSFSKAEILTLKKQFHRLDTEGQGAINIEDFSKIPEFQSNPFAGRLANIFDSDSDNKIDFREFVSTLSVFSPNGTREQKLRTAFKLYDHDGDGKISVEDLKSTFALIVADSLSPDDFDKVVDRVFKELYPTYTPGDEASISFEDFIKVNNTDQFAAKFTIHFEQS